MDNGLCKTLIVSRRCKAVVYCIDSAGRLTSTALMPTSMTTAPSLIQSPVIISALPQAAMTMSACEQISWPFGVRECTTVTVASRRCNSMAAGVPTILLLPTTHADLPLIETPERSSSSMQPCKTQAVRLTQKFCLYLAS